MRKITLLIALILLGVTGSYAQASLYGFSVSTERYTPITGGTVIISATDATNSLDSYVSSQLTLPSEFTFAGVSYTNYYVTGNGQLSFGTTTPSGTTYTSLTSSFGGNAVLAPFSADLSNGASVLSEIRVDRVDSEMVIQWSNFRRYSRPEVFSFQIRLNLNDKSIKFVYDGNGSYASSTSYQPQVGIKSAVGDYKALTSGTWAVPTVISTGATSSSVLNFTGSNGFASGLTYTFTAPASCNGAPAGGTITGDTTRLICTGSTPAAITVPMANTVVGLSYQWQQSANGTDWADVTTGTGATTLSYTPAAFAGTTVMYRLKTTCTGTGDVAYSSNTVTISPQSAPLTQATALTLTPGVNSLTAAWTNGSGSRRLVFVSSTPIVDPVATGNFPAFTASTTYANNGQQLVYDGTASTVTIGGLNCTTPYYVKVYEYNRCGTGPYDVFVNVVSDTNVASATPNSPATATLPVTNTFAGFTGSNLSTVLPGWYEASITTTSGAAPSNVGPVVNDSSWTSSTVFTATTAKVNLYTNNRNAWIISPKVTLTDNSRLKFKAALTNYNSSSAPSVGMQGTDDKVTVYVSTDGCGINWTPIYVFSAANTTTLTNALVDYALPLSAYTGQTVQIAFQATDGPTDDAPDYDFHIGNVIIELQPACDSPLVVTAAKTGFNTAALTWNAPSSTAPALGYEYYVSTTNTAPTESTVATGSVGAGVLTANPSGLTANTTYYFWVRSVCASDSKSGWVAAAAPIYTGYCTPAPLSVDGTGIINVAMGSINNPTGAETNNYGNYVSMSTAADAGSTVNFGITYGTGFTYGTKVWVDWNNDADFDDAGELVYTGVSTNANPTTLNGSFVIPASAAVVGSHTVRIGGTDNDAGGTPCYSGYFGSYEDYTLVVTMPSAPVITSFTPASACAANATLTVTGTGLLNATLKVGDTTIPTTSVTATEIVATVPAGVSGLVTVTTFVGSAVSTTEFSVTTPASLAISSGQSAICAGQSTGVVTITDGTTAYDTFVWSPATGVTGTAETGYIFNPTQTTTYTLTASQSSGPCTISVPYTVTVNSLPTALVVAPASQTVCQGATQAITATGGTASGIATIGTGTTAPTAYYPNPFSGYYGGVKTQILFTAAELQAQGLAPGMSISSLSFDFFASIAATCNDLRIKVGETTQTNLTSGFLPSASLTTVYNANYTPVAGTTGWVPFNFTSQYVWNGGNLVVEVAHNAGNGGNGDGTKTKTTTTTENTVFYGAKDSVTPAGMTSYDAVTSFSSTAASTSRPNIRFNYTVTHPVTWSPVTNLYTDAAATTPYTGAATRTVYFKGATNETYTATATNTNGCSVSATAAIAVNVVDAPVAAANQSFCQSATVSQLVAEGTAIQWYADATGGQVLSPNAALSSGITYYATQTVNGCESVNRTAVAVNITVVPAPQTQDVVACNSYTLPELTEGVYYTAAAGQGTLVPAGTVITQNTTLFVRVQSGDCSAENMFTVNINTTSAPSAAADQSFCQSGVVGQLSAEGTNIKWYASATSTDALGADAALTNGAVYYATQTVNGCESVQRTAVTVTINITSAPSATAEQAFCQSGVVGQLSAEGTGIKWYASATSTDALGADAALTNGAVYYATQTVNGCESTERTAVTVTVTAVEAPVVSNVTVCDSYTLPALDGVVYRTAGQGSGDVVPAGTVITATTNLYAVAQLGDCIAETPFTVTINPLPVIEVVSPQIVSTQNDFATIADIVIASNADLVWYATEADALAGTNPLFADTVISANTTYYVTASSGTCTNIAPVTITEILGGKSFDMANFAYYPNPVNSELTISYSAEITTVEVFNLLGQHVLTVKPNATVAKVNMSALAEGAYVVKVAAGSVTKTVKVIKK